MIDEDGKLAVYLAMTAGGGMKPTDEQKEYNDYLLEILRNCGLFKCTECLYALWEDRGFGMEYKCCHPRTLPHSAWNDLDTAMRGCACYAFEPSAQAKHNLVERMTVTSEAVRKLIDYAWRHTDRTGLGNSPDEAYLGKLIREIDGQGMVRT